MNLLACYETCTTAHTLLYCLTRTSGSYGGPQIRSGVERQASLSLRYLMHRYRCCIDQKERIFFSFLKFLKKIIWFQPRFYSKWLSYLLDSIDITRKVYQYILVARIAYYFFKGLNRSPSFHFNLHKHRPNHRCKYTFTCTVTRFITRALILISVRLCIYDNRALPSSSSSSLSFPP